jgi:hypothetical protein
MLATPVSANGERPDLSINEKQLAELREKAQAEEYVLQSYLEQIITNNTLKTREDVVSFLDYIDSLPLPYLPETYLRIINHYNYYIRMMFRAWSGEIYYFDFHLDNERIANRAGELLHTQHISQDDYVNIYHHNYLSHLMEINGYFIVIERVRAANHDMDMPILITQYNPEETYKGLTFTSFSDAPWKMSYNTAEALLVLQYTAGLISLIPEWQLRLDVNGDGVVDTADALEILKLIANS